MHNDGELEQVRNLLKSSEQEVRNLKKSIRANEIEMNNLVQSRQTDFDQIKHLETKLAKLDDALKQTNQVNREAEQTRTDLCHQVLFYLKLL